MVHWSDLIKKFLSASIALFCTLCLSVCCSRLNDDILDGLFFFSEFSDFSEISKAGD